MRPWLIVVLLGVPITSHAFTIFSHGSAICHPARSTVTICPQEPNAGDSGSNYRSVPQSKFKPRKKLTLAELREKMIQNPAKFQQTIESDKSKSSRRTRRRVDQPKQTYVYAAQRKNKPTKRSGAIANELIVPGTTTTDTVVAAVSPVDAAVVAIHNSTIALRRMAQEMGLKAATQHCDPIDDDDDDNHQPVLVGQIRVGDGMNSSSYAYLIEKPVGWSILGGSLTTGKSHSKNKILGDNNIDKPKKLQKDAIQRIKVKDEDGSIGVLEYSELDILALLTPAEREEYSTEHQINFELQAKSTKLCSTVDTENEFVEHQEQEEEEEEEEENDDSDDDDDNDVDLSNDPTMMDKLENSNLSPQTMENARRIAARAKNRKSTASFSSIGRPSIVTWLKELKATEGTPIRGGNFWTVVAGASEVDDTGLVLLCPKSNSDNVFVEYTEYIAVVGNGGNLAPLSKIKTVNRALPDESIQLDVMSRVRKGRGDDIIQTARVVISERPSVCTNVVEVCQKQLMDGIRGDPLGNPFDRRAQRRLIHCKAMSVSSIMHDDSMQWETNYLPDGIAVLAERRNHLEYKYGSFLGRSSLRASNLTTAYREINGAADGFPGWTVDRYDQWLLVSHDPKKPRGPLPSIHDGYTAGVYYLESKPDRSSMGSEHHVRPKLLEGRPAPDLFPVLENGINYLVSLNRDLTSGLFLDQRPHRAWLKRHCCADTRILNCFAHTGAFSVAAASAGASTVNIDLSKKWLDRFPEHLKANGIEFDERHDCIYGDCFDWLDRLAKRDEKFDIVILDPPSASIGKKKKRWSVRNDMDELVAMAAVLVKKDGLLWTTTNSASIPADKFARLCRQGLDTAGIKHAKLERLQPMPVDFPSVGPPPVKNFVWRIP